MEVEELNILKVKCMHLSALFCGMSHKHFHVRIDVALQLRKDFVIFTATSFNHEVCTDY